MDTLTKSFGKLTIPLLVLLAICFFAAPAHAKYGGGAGEPNDPYLIFDANQMNEIGLSGNWDDWDKHFKLMADIDLSAFTETAFNIIANFTGVFDGSGHTISNFTYTSTDTDYIGLFGCVDGEVKDLGLLGPNVDAGTGGVVGSLVGKLRRGTITNCYVEGGSVSGNDFVGGLVGYSNDGMISDCYSKGHVSGDNNVGGLVGYNNPYGTIINCYSEGSVSGENTVGGLCGSNGNTISNCYASGSISGTTIIGGLVGTNSEGSITNSYWDIETSGEPNMCGSQDPNGTGCDNANGKTTAEMQDPNTFMAAGWDFVDQPDGPSDIWAEPAGGGYPILWWQLPQSQLPPLHTFSGGSGTANEPYLISTSNDLNHIGHNPRLMQAHFKLINDIDLAGIDFFFIGSRAYAYGGVFDGKGHTISNFTHSSTDTHNVGLFECVGGEVKDLGLIDPNVDARTGDYVGSLIGIIDAGTITGCYVEGGSVSGRRYVGGLAGYNYYGTITNSYATGSVSGDDYVGGLLGYNEWGTISDCYADSSVEGDENVGGLVGYNYRGTIANCYVEGSIVSGNYEVGGLVGRNYYGGTVNNCYATGSVSGNERVGGLVGKNERGTIDNCYSTASVSGTGWDVGGLVGYNSCYRDECGSITNSYWDIETSGEPNMCGSQDPNGTGCDNANGKTTAEMQTQSTFTDAGWDFVGETANGTEDIWKIREGVDYAKLAWQTAPADFDYDGEVDFTDFAILGAQWRQLPGEPSADIAPDGGDGKVDWFDLAALADNWLAGVNVEPPSQASNPNPADGATNVDINADLSWTAGGAGAESHDVYFGTTEPPPFIRNQTAKTFDPGTMTISTTYYWRIDEVNPLGTTTGTVWSFTTESGPPPP